MQAKISTKANRLRVFGESGVLVPLQKSVLQQREGSLGSICKTKLQLRQPKSKKLLYIEIWIESKE